MYGFYGRILKINLTKKQYNIVPIEEKILLKYFGGKGFGSYLLYTLNPKGIDPLSPENCLIFATGPVTGSIIWGSSRYGVFTKSPQTNFYSESYSGGKTPEAMDSAGFDATVITGRSKEPCVLLVRPNGVDFHDASNIWGMNTFDTEDTVNKLFGAAEKKTKSGSVVIGPAGEKLVRFAVIENDYWRSAGRTGTGTVMGSKNLKAIVFQGNKKRQFFDEEKIKIFSKEFAKSSKNHPSVKAFKSRGTSNMLKKVNKAGAFPNRYWSKSYLDNWQNISSDALHKQCSVTPRACPKCFIACARMTTILKGRHAGLKLEGPEYETIYAFGGLCLVDSIEEIAYLNDICDKLGMDTISAGNLCGFAIEAVQRKKIKYDIDYGDVDAIAGLLNKIAKRESIGDTLALGIRHAAKKWDLEDIAVHVKGLEPPGYDPRVLKGCGLAFATSDRGACHLRANFHAPELAGVIAPDTIKGKADLFVELEDHLTFFDTLILCRFYKGLYSWNKLSELMYMITGSKENEQTLRKKVFEISDIVRHFNIREGLKMEDDNLPKRLLKDFSKTGRGIKKQELEIMLQDYYKRRGWNKNGVPKDIDLKGFFAS